MFGITERIQDTASLRRLIPCGFHLTFENGNTISVQFGLGSYSSNRKQSKPKSNTAEIAIWNTNGDWYVFDDNTVKGWCSPDEVAEWIQFAKSNTF
jgi:hypothetical protein